MSEWYGADYRLDSGEVIVIDHTDDGRVVITQGDYNEADDPESRMAMPLKIEWPADIFWSLVLTLAQRVGVIGSANAPDDSGKG